MSLEIERKWKLNSFPTNLEASEEFYMEQTYLVVDKNKELRIRKKTNKKTGFSDYRLTYKSSGDLTRMEKEVEISEEMYLCLLETKNTTPIKKDYKKYKIGDNILEVSLVDEGLSSQFYYAEVEFESEEDANDFELNIEHAIDVTYDKSYKMKNYWKSTRM